MSRPASSQEINRTTPSSQTLAEREEHRRGYIAREMVQCTLPHSDPGDIEIFERQDGNLILTVRGGYDPIARRKIGIPYGPIAKLLLVWITSEAVKSDDGKIQLAKTLGGFLRILGLTRDTGRGKRSDAKRVTEQLLRLVNSEFSTYYVGDDPERVGYDAIDMRVAPRRSLWWDRKNIDQEMLFDSYIILGREFMEAIKKSYVPVDLTIAGRLKKSPLAIDLFFWMTYRLYRMDPREDITISWKDLASQFGADYKSEKNLRAAVRRALAMVATEWPTAERASDLSNRGLTLHGIPKKALPIQEKQGEVSFYRRRSGDPFNLSAAELLKAKEHAGKYDVFVMREEWEKWCKGKDFVPDSPIGHFIDFLQTHRQKNG